MSNLFSNMFSNQMNNQNLQAMSIQMIENMRRSGRINQTQYDVLMKNRDNPDDLLNAMLQNNVVTNEQYSQARNSVGSFFGIK